MLILIVLTLANAGMLAGSIRAYRMMQKQVNYARGYEENACLFRVQAYEDAERAQKHAEIAKLHATKAEEGAIKSQLLAPSFAICDTCKTLVARYDRLEDESVVCINCK
jgi:hypothetical protein